MAAGAGQGWPAMTMAEVRDALTAPGARFEMEEVAIDGIATRTWKNAPASLAALLAASRGQGERTFLVLDDDRVSYAAHHRAVAALAGHLVALGIGRGDRVALAMRNLPEWPMVFFAIGAIGAIVVPLNAWWSADELDFALRDSGARLLICDGERLARLATPLSALPELPVIVTRSAAPGRAVRLESLIGAPADWAGLADADLPQVGIAPDDAAAIFYTSGTTGRPKGAVLSHRNLASNVLSNGYAAARVCLRRGEIPPEPAPRVALMVIPFFHVTGCSASLLPLVATGSTIVLMPKWDATQALGLIERERVTTTGGVPTIAWQLLEHPDRARYDLSSLEAIAYGGAPSAPDLVRRIRSDLSAAPGNGWGMTETTATVTSLAAEDYLHRPDSAGAPVAVADLAIRDADGIADLPPGTLGELWARGPMVVRGYWNRPEESAATFVDGWVRTGDIARIDTEGFLFIADRAKDVIIRGGENIYSIEVENVLYAHPSVTDAALIGVPHRTLGEEPVAVVHLCPGCTADAAELQAFVRARLAGFKVPVAIRFMTTPLPRNASGKILKSELKHCFVTEQADTA
ncbi:class I adenylate-forming enzyme family protein [Sphingomonas sp. CV7422]|uniref:class I adenylate-forming enzyme family protein n=1 Tax=Sphingomonas sp. CV7422 TaxID=3018036 RepID=UPI0022FF1FEF|nr:AMP-binding protein [Sphingomonas sp. CV7422]